MWISIQLIVIYRTFVKINSKVKKRMGQKNSILEERRKRVSPDVRQRVNRSFEIVDRIHEILVAKGMKQKDLALLLGKKEAEISKWMRGTHNFTIDTIASIENALDASILQVCHSDIECTMMEAELA